MALNKIDVLDAADVKKKITKLKNFIKKTGVAKPQVFAISGVTGKGVEEVLRELYKKIEAYRLEQDKEIV